MYKHFNGDVCIYGQDHIDIATIIWDEKLKDIPFILLEDGTGNYVTRNSLGENRRHCMGHNNRVDSIFLTGIWRIPNDLKRKVQIIDIRYLWGNKSDI
ncbi:glycosyltransferase family 52 [Selenomonas ruminantium]|uniref:glycosyltransferase family 52 n=1 Tax=Selenomonas ruminantium TaxID=971 RepID=UPI0012FE9822